MQAPLISSDVKMLFFIQNATSDNAIPVLLFEVPISLNGYFTQK